MRSETIGARSFVLEKGRLKGWYYRIRERRHAFTTWYFVWDRFNSEEEALKQWEGFVALLQARELAAADIAQG